MRNWPDLDAFHAAGHLRIMSDKPKEKPALTPAGERAARAREERQAAALRANLLRRKSQARDRAGPPEPEKKP
jgi:hypothetical protein